MQTNKLWKRIYRVHFPDLGFSFSNEEGEGLKISFDIDKDLTQETNKTVLRIWNLTNDTRAKIEKSDTLLEIYAGYKENGGAVKIFRGTVIIAQTTDEGKDVVTELRLADGEIALRDSIVSVSFEPNADGRRIIETLVNAMGLTLSFGENVEIGTYANGFSYVGYAKDALTSVCNAFGCDWSVQNGIVQVIMAGGTFASRGVVFSAPTGLIGSPSRIIRSKPSEDKETNKQKRRRQQKKTKPEKRAGWEITTLLSPSINPGDAVKVESRLISGWFRVEKVSHSGETFGDAWESKFELIEGLQ